MKIGYVVPEWPGQTHLWIWREISHLREWQVPIRLFSTRRPPERDRGRHAFAADAMAETFYLWPVGFWRAVGLLLYGLCTSPIGFVRCIAMALSIPVETRPLWRHVLPLLVPACRLARQVRREGITHLHSHTPANSAILCMMVKRLTGVPFSLIVNANMEWWGGAMREKFAESSFTLLVTEWLVAQMRRDYPELLPESYGLGRVGVDVRKWSRTAVEQARPAGQASAESGANAPFRILSVGRLNKSKGFDVLLGAVAQLRDRNVGVKLNIGGDGPERDALTALVVQLKLGDCVTFLGSVSEEQYLAEMAQADCFVLASNSEPMGVVYMEAMSMEVATIGTAAGGVPEIITNGVDGLLVPPRDSNSLAGAIQRLMDDPGFRHALGQSGRRKVMQQFDSRIWAGTLYRRLFGHAPGESLTGSEQGPEQGSEHGPTPTLSKGARRTGVLGSAKSSGAQRLTFVL